MGSFGSTQNYYFSVYAGRRIRNAFRHRNLEKSASQRRLGIGFWERPKLHMQHLHVQNLTNKIEKNGHFSCRPVRTNLELDSFELRVPGYGEENKTKSRLSKAANAATVKPATGWRTLRSWFDVRSTQQALLSGPASQLQSGMGTSSKTSSERPFCIWDHPGRRSRHSNSSVVGPGFCSGVVFEICSVSRNAALGRARQTSAQWPATGPHRRVQSARARFSQLLSRPALGGTKPRAVSSLISNRYPRVSVSRQQWGADLSQ